MTQYFNQSDHRLERQQARARMPKAEVLLWSKLKSRQLLGCKFRRQFGVDAYRLDFYSPELKLGIELDGETHYVGAAPAHDRRRQQFIESLGIRVLRFLNDEVYENLEGVWEAIARAAREQMERMGSPAVRGRRSKRKRRGESQSDATPPAPPC